MSLVCSAQLLLQPADASATDGSGTLAVNLRAWGDRLNTEKEKVRGEIEALPSDVNLDFNAGAARSPKQARAGRAFEAA